MARKSVGAKHKPAVKKQRQLTRAERKTLSDRFYSYLHYVDALRAKKDIAVQVKSDLKKYHSALQRQSSFLSRF